MQWLFILVPYKHHLFTGEFSATGHEISLELWGLGAIQSPWEGLSISTSNKINDYVCINNWWNDYAYCE